MRFQIDLRMEAPEQVGPDEIIQDHMP